MTKKKLGTTWLGGCSGCHMSLLDIDERILDVAKLADIVKCPIGTYNTRTKRTSIRDCIPCDPGSLCANANNQIAVSGLCPAG